MTRAAGFLGAAAIAGTVHGAFSVYWGLGGSALLDTLGAMADQFDRRWLVVVGVLKIMAAVVPFALLRDGRHRRTLRLLCWCGSTCLIL